jgi:hypothetical protein
MGFANNSKDLSGGIFGNVIALSKLPTKVTERGKHISMYLVECKVHGHKHRVTVSSMTVMKGCPCKEQRLVTKNPLRKHGLKGTPLYSRYRHILLYCSRENIDIDPAWKDQTDSKGLLAFKSWLEDELAKTNLTVETSSILRKDKMAGYFKNNLMIGPKSSNIVTVLGEEMSLGRAVEEFSDYSYKLIQRRLDNGWDIERALLAPEQPSGTKYSLSSTPLNHKERSKLAAFGRQKLKRFDFNSNIMIGETYGRLRVLNKSYPTYNLESKIKKPMVECECSCFDGEKRRALLDAYLVSKGKLEYCSECAKWNRPIHERGFGLSGDRLYQRILGCIQRCTNPNHKAYYRYGGRGIKVYKEWLNSPMKFHEYLLSNWPNIYDLIDHGYTLDREDNDGNYEPGNIRLATPKEQSNNKGSNIYLGFIFNETKKISITEAIEKYGNFYSRQGEAARGRFDQGWDHHRLLMCPIIKGLKREKCYPQWNQAPSEEEKQSYLRWLSDKKNGIHNEVFHTFKEESVKCS